MDKAQMKIYRGLKKDFEGNGELTAVDKQRLEVLACVLDEMRKLQTFINEHGPTYQVVGKSGDTYSRARPEYQQLQEVRQRHSVLLDKLQGDKPTDSVDAFIAL